MSEPLSDDDGEVIISLTAEERQSIRDHARAAADAMGGAAAAIMERWPKLSGVDEAALKRAVWDAWRVRGMAEALEKLAEKGGY